MGPTEEELETLKNENLELKLSDIRKDMANLKIDLHQHLDRILEQTSTTNGSVARALERINILERQDNKIKLEKINNEFAEYKKSMKFWHTLSENRWLVGIFFMLFYALAIQEFRDALLTFLRLK